MKLSDSWKIGYAMSGTTILVVLLISVASSSPMNFIYSSLWVSALPLLLPIIYSGRVLGLVIISPIEMRSAQINEPVTKRQTKATKDITVIAPALLPQKIFANDVADNSQVPVRNIVYKVRGKVIQPLAVPDTNEQMLYTGWMEACKNFLDAGWALESWSMDNMVTKHKLTSDTGWRQVRSVLIAANLVGIGRKRETTPIPSYHAARSLVTKIELSYPRFTAPVIKVPVLYHNEDGIHGVIIKS